MVHDYIGIVGAVKDVLSERVKAWQSWQAVQVTPPPSPLVLYFFDSGLRKKRKKNQFRGKVKLHY